MSLLSEDQIPVIVGVGDLADRPEDPFQGREPLKLIAEAARLADADAGGGWIPRLTRIDVINQIGWGYPDLAASVKESLGATGAVSAQQEIGGETPVKYMMKAAARIVEGSAEVTLIAGGEAIKTIQECMKRGKPPKHWTTPVPDYRPASGDQMVTPLALRYGLAQPIDVYPIYENACRAGWKQTFAEAQAESAEIWAQFSEVAANNPAAWEREPMSAESILRPGPKNRPIAFPYLKTMVAQIGVNQGAAFIVTSLARARAHGVPANRIVHIWSGAGACEPDDFLARDVYTHSTAMNAALDSTLAANGLKVTDLDAVELYSCFPTVPKMALRRIDLPDTVVPTVTGGLTAFGGPVNNYMGHAIVAMVRALRGPLPKKGLVFGQGAFVTKHHAAVLSNQPSPGVPRNIDAQPDADAARGPVPALLETYEGEATIETYTVIFRRNGDPQKAPIIARTASGERTVALVTDDDPDALVELCSGLEMIGARGRISVVDGVNRWKFEKLQVPKWTGAASPVRVEREGAHIAIVLLNRPGARNAVNASVTSMLQEIVDWIETDDDIRVVVFGSTSPEVFCAGADLSAVNAGKAGGLIGKYGFAGFVDAPRTKPWIAAVTGFALGGGTEIPLACDLIVAGKGTQFGLPEVRRGLIAAAGGLYRLARAIPRVIAAEIVLTGEPISAQRALELGLVNRVVDEPLVREEALKIARVIADNAPLSVRGSLKVLRKAADLTDEELAKLSYEAVAPILASKDVIEGTRAFLEKRKPKWQGK